MEETEFESHQGQDDHDDGDDCDHDTVGFCYKQEIMDIGQWWSSERPLMV